MYKAAGVVGAIGPWNWPLMITIWQIGPSLRMGNTVVAEAQRVHAAQRARAPRFVMTMCFRPDVLIGVSG